MRIVGIDYSLTCPCVCVYNPNKGKFKFENCNFYYLTTNKKYILKEKNITGNEGNTDYKSDEERYFNIALWVMKNIGKKDIVYLEGYSLGSKGLIFNIAEHTGLLKHMLWAFDVKMNVVPPTVNKKFATGKGNANKELMQEKFIEETGFNLKDMLKMTDKQWNPSSDIIDAYYLCKYGANENVT
jgi:crossover junction endodeoxyribonuclease RuvC